MCGIAGFADAEWNDFAAASRGDADAALVHRMCDVIRHRGPDDEGIHVEPGVGLGMRRLSIIDLSTGQQPIHNEDRTVWVVFNGEIYNYRELRARARGAGHRFYTSSDTETIVHAYEEWGEGAFARLRGMFGIALWDRPRRTLLLARDRAGQQAAALRGARRPALLRLRDQVAAGGRRGRSRARSRGARPLPGVPLRAARSRRSSRACESCRPATSCRWRDGRVRRRSTGRSAPPNRFAAPKTRPRRRCAAVLADAVRSHMVSDVPLGAFLSGGVDSSLVVGLMARASSRPVKTFSIGFDDPQFDELEHARDGRAALRHRPSRVRRAARRAVDPRPPDRALRRAVRRLVGDSDVVRLGDRAPPRHRRAVRRRRRRAVRRLRPLPAAPARRAVRPAGAARRPPGCRRGVAARSRTARGGRTSCGTSRAPTTAAIWTRSRSSSRTRKTRCIRPACAPRSPSWSAEERAGAPVRRGSRRCRRTAG